jgi:LPXTG-motif cell wall-anchored protein
MTKQTNTIIFVILGIAIIGGIAFFLLRKPKEEAIESDDTDDDDDDDGNGTGNLACSLESSSTNENKMYSELKKALVNYMDAVEGKPSPVNVSTSAKAKWKMEADQKGVSVRKLSGKGLIFQWRTNGNFVRISGVKLNVPNSVYDRLYLDVDSGCIA